MLTGLLVSLGLLFAAPWAYRKWKDKRNDIVAQSGIKDFSDSGIK